MCSRFTRYCFVLLTISSTSLVYAAESNNLNPVNASVVPVTAPDPIKAIQHSGLEFSAFFDVQLTQSRSDQPGFPDRAQSGFLMEDGALFLRKNTSRWELFVDLPVSRAKTNVDRDGDGKPDGNTSDDSNMVFATEKAQLFGRFNAAENVKVTIGQFDTVFGIEANDSKDRIFANFSSLSNTTLPYTHTGLMGDWQFVENSNFKLFVANPASRGSTGSIEGDDNLEFGASIGYAGEVFRAQLGGLTRSMRNLNSESDRKTLVELVLGATLGKFSVDLEVVTLRDPRKNTLTPDPLDVEQTGQASMIIASYKLSEADLVAIRLEKSNKDPGAVQIYELNGGAISLQHRMDENVLFRADAYSQETKANETADKIKSTKFVLSSVFTF